MTHFTKMKDVEKSAITQQDIPVPPNPREPNWQHWHLLYIALSMLFFLVIISALMMITVLGNFMISYQNRDLLIELYTKGNESGVTWTTSQSSVQPILTSLGTTDSEDSHSRTTDEGSVATTLTSNATTEQVTPRDDLTTLPSKSSTIQDSFTQGTTPKLINPIVLLNENSSKTVYYNCSYVCEDPYITIARIDVVVSVNETRSLAGMVNIRDQRVAKRRVAYEALNVFHPELLGSSIVDEEWEYPIPSSCKSPSEIVTWSACNN